MESLRNSCVRSLIQKYMAPAFRRRSRATAARCRATQMTSNSWSPCSRRTQGLAF